ncbi:component of SufBCD complex [Thioclava sp. GXIMD2076]|uniref:Component of SufBCD complex n=1 Tax=Thioclava kandeliae TaxID=3070818 RepID=A0ABV1SCB9_9RHOB
MDLSQTLFSLIDMRSFSSIWYWVILAVAWSTASHFIMGVPYDLVTQYRRDTSLAPDLVALGGVNARRLLRFGRARTALTALWWCLTSFLVFSGFYYGAELAQACLFLVVPLSVVMIMAMRNAATLAALATRAEAGQIADLLHRIRFRVQLLGMASIFLTAIWGMLINLLHHSIRLW